MKTEPVSRLKEIPKDDSRVTWHSRYVLYLTSQRISKIFFLTGLMAFENIYITFLSLQHDNVQVKEPSNSCFPLSKNRMFLKTILKPRSLPNHPKVQITHVGNQISSQSVFFKVNKINLYKERKYGKCLLPSRVYNVRAPGVSK